MGSSDISTRLHQFPAQTAGIKRNGKRLFSVGFTGAEFYDFLALLEKYAVEDESFFERARACSVGRKDSSSIEGARLSWRRTVSRFLFVKGKPVLIPAKSMRSASG